MRQPVWAILSLGLVLSAGPVFAQGTVVHVEASVSGAASSAPDGNRQLFIRIIPRFDTGTRLSKSWTLDVSASAAANTDTTALTGRETTTTRDIGPHRAWIRVASPRFEARVGLQQISFGSASIFRPLMWFDRIDARDPTQYTEGVYGVLVRYMSTGNTSLWAWGLYGNNDPRGWDTLATRNATAEFGGRVQVPLPRGEIGGAYHRRRVDTSLFAAVPDDLAAPVEGKAAVQPSAISPSGDVSPREDRVGLDGKWDVEMGLWFEASVIRTDSTLLRDRWRVSYCLGADYTFGIGRGLTLIGEHFYLDGAVPRFSPSAELKLTALTATYPVGVANTLTGAVYYEWSRDDVYRFVEWRRTYDHWRVHLVGFWNPDRASIFAPGSKTGALTGKGVELVVVASY